MKNIFLLLLPIISIGQVKLPTIPQPTQFTNYNNQNWSNPNNNILKALNPMDIIYGKDEQQRIQQQNQQIIQETQQREKQKETQMREIYTDINQSKSDINYNLPSFSNVKGTEQYRNVYEKMLTLNIENYSVKDLNFEIENAYLENKEDKAEFDQIIKNSGDYILAKMKELKYDTQSNVAKNYMLFQFFSENLTLKSNGLKHTPFKYDFVDYMGNKDWTKMFVSKLLKTKTGQCHSMPLLYLILAEQIQAEAYLSFSPNHSFIKFRDKNNKWYNIELTNGMFTAPSFLINSGYIKAEALQNHIYLQNLSKQELFSAFYVDLANGYIHKFGYDDFVEKVTDKALELYPNNVNAQMIKANYSAIRFEFVAKQLGINPRDNKQLQHIKGYPDTVALLQETNTQGKKVEQLGYTEMPAEAYESWLNSLKEAKRKQENETLNAQFKGTIIKTLKN
ncbi:hypothetical protein [Flavobacterium gawalongense]|uniref:Protein SirB1 N-terminal domain-containing protein n=1 Tax=Flavobacterium gawalongense TaxID=2594432 RepID=A0A553BYY0_9FLAO|nr:hypothetical protein [Flavobacterium gawalongense]TRX04600.1 hypothetical protein FNW33_00880 [Flavobacterium gawalongense]TRX10487.1 hypothetical protein FNW12_00865 [Flavobacterium gawalongense]TRX13531.1 hypothetical protein FNW11_01375 [Flavobacterium gawalongense]TRX15537.1 hypothetical protein FNW10_00315 [Flavobacterium gawalongense]TRX31376.1 hypothetical protein FNW38_00315 [Flavobacterium gawalongense]